MELGGCNGLWSLVASYICRIQMQRDYFNRKAEFSSCFGLVNRNVLSLSVNVCIDLKHANLQVGMSVLVVTCCLALAHGGGEWAWAASVKHVYLFHFLCFYECKNKTHMKLRGQVSSRKPSTTHTGSVALLFSRSGDTDRPYACCQPVQSYSGFSSEFRHVRKRLI